MEQAKQAAKTVAATITRDDTEGMSGPPSWPMPVKRFLAGNYLRPSDVVLTRTKGAPYSALIRWSTGSMFSHSGLVFHVRNRAEGFNNSFIIEAGTDGVDLTNIRDYAESSRHVIAIKRLNHHWFDDSIQRYVRGHLLDHIKDEYDFRRVFTLAAGLMRRAFMRDKHPFRRVKTKRGFRLKKRRGMIANEFICSGLVQYGYFNAIYRLYRAQQRGELGSQASKQGVGEAIARAHREPCMLDFEALRHVIFRRDLAEAMPLNPDGSFHGFGEMRAFWDHLHATTPKDIEETPALEWQYVIKNRKVYQVSTEADVRMALKEGYGVDPFPITAP